MDMLHSASSALEYPQTQAPDEINALCVSSGNIQSSTVSLGDGVENQRPLSLGEGTDEASIKAPFRLFQPPVALGSNDFADRSFEQKQQRKSSKSRYPSRALLNQDRPYLSHPKYEEYRRRPRQDIGKDGKAIWPQPIEDAFQDALVAIKPMGRKKWSEGGRLHGRNMLIARYIYERTGVWRERKQVSSHIQVLDRFLKGVPEWDRLTKFEDDNDATPESRQVYHNSTSHHMAKRNRMTGYPERQRPHVPVKREADASYTTDEKAPGTIYLATYRIQRSHFEMWVSLPGELQHALHNYTRLKDNETDMMDEHLDQVVDNWVHEFPQLHRIKYELTTFNRCDIVLFNAHFHLMNDFPPRHSKLGIGLELDFQCDEWPEMQWTREKKNWSCTTHIYQDGHLLMAPMHEECYGSEEGNVKPLFQSRWWASVLTSLTEAKKLAEETKDLAAMELADTRSRNFFKGLTIMQEIFALRCKRDERVHKNQKATRAAILLWRFSQAPSSSEAVTTWQHVTLRSGSDSPAPNVSIPPPAGMDLPALPMNPLIDYGTSIGSFEDNSQLPLQQQDFSFDMFPASMDEELCQDGFMTMTSAQMAGLDQLQSSFHFPGPRRLMTDSPLDHQQETFVTARDDSQRPLPVSMQAVNFFELPQLLGQETSLSNMTYVEDRGLNGAQHETAQEHDQPLARFNVQAHQALQEHLGADGSGNSTAGHTSPILKREQDISQSNEVGEHEWHQMNEEDLSVLQFLTDEQRRHESVNDQPWTREDQDDETLRAALLAASGANSDHDQQRQARPQTHDGLDHGQAYARAHAYAERQHQPLRVLPLAVRPVLQSHHSFPGLRSQDSPSHVLPSNSNSNRFEQGFGNNHNLACHNESMLQSHFAGQTMDHISASFRMDDLYAPVAVSEGSRGLPRAQSEPDPYLGALSQLVPPLPVLGSQHDDNETISSTQTRSQSQGTDGLTLDGSFVEVSMDDVHDEMTLL